MEPTTIRQKQRTWTGVVDRPEFVVVRREDQTFPGVLFEWRRRTEPDGLSRRSARVIHLDADNILRQSWFPESSIEPAPHAVAHEPRMVG